MTVSDPMRDGAVFNQPMDPTGRQAVDFPMYENISSGSATPVPGRDGPIQSGSSTGLRDTSGSSGDGGCAHSRELATDGTVQSTTKRQPHKLSKVRSNNHGAADGNNKDGAVDKPSTERPRSVLTKKALQTKGSTPPTADGEGTGIPP
ncbi:hypothetical protein ACRE_078250 [Hapsidospora chrysogenum ATCC 11550]|uniref:Uncharacterized protein n=1 Tax=Hapsidospora chrysogenum (strain ATCC 11550 / CBS 779.69 / DSM 880 / IAM 14645 / JCM 23072 / IMI 49137) TaxID=857340 RepID=A0A086SWJ5_HAPC1|nr:hypothetical protein ACRE_078250 [Hapsidospora chrysogenum ATCC 11550]